MEGKYQESLDLFREIYFNEDGSLDTEGYSHEDGEIHEGYIGSDKDSYYELGIDEDDRSKIVGRSAFTPKIIGVSKEGEENGDFRYFLTLDDYGRFNNDDVEFALPAGMRVQKIDVTEMSQEDIMRIVEQMLNMSNEEIMTMFNCFDLHEIYSTELQDLLLDDTVQACLEQNGYQILGKSYEERYDSLYDMCLYTIKTITDKGEIELSNGRSEAITLRTNGDYEFIYQSPNSSHDKSVKSELGQLLMRTIREKSPREQLDAILASRKEKSGITLQEVGEGTTGSFTRNPSQAIQAMSSLENGVVKTEEKDEHSQEEG